MTKSEVAALVRKYINGARHEDITFTVSDNAVQQGDGWYRVAVRPSRLPASLFPLYEFVAEYEVKIADAEGINILLSVGEPLSEESETQERELVAA